MAAQLTSHGSPPSLSSIAMKMGYCSNVAHAEIMDCKPIRLPTWLAGYLWREKKMKMDN